MPQYVRSQNESTADFSLGTRKSPPEYMPKHPNPRAGNETRLSPPPERGEGGAREAEGPQS